MHIFKLFFDFTHFMLPKKIVPDSTFSSKLTIKFHFREKMTTPIMINLATLSQNAKTIVMNGSVVVKVITLSVILGYILSSSEFIMTHFSVSPGYVLPPNFRIWTFLTHTILEYHIWNVIADVAVVILCGKLLEPMWGAMEMLIFFVVVNFGVALCTVFFYLTIYLVTKNEEYLFETHIYGLAGYLAGFSVAAKQVMPDAVLVTLPLGKLRNSHIPLLLFLCALLLRMIGLTEGPFTAMFGFGMIVSWIYLRFYQKHSKGNRGDMTDTFDFASFFPSQLKPCISIVSNTIFMGLVKIKICKKPQRKYDVSSPSTITITLPGTDPLDAERRRQLALKALNERLNKNDTPAKWPVLVEEEQESKESQIQNKTKETKLPIPDFKENDEKNNTENE